jgi:DNA-binding NarL/FixJ family response regulator
MTVSRKSGTPNTKKRIVIVDDHPMTRAGIAQWIRNEPDMEVCCEAETAEQGLEAAIAMKPDLVLTDITMHGKDGLELIKDLHAMQPHLPVIVISMHEESLYAGRVLRAGARGYLMKHEGGSKIVQAIRCVLAGGIYVSDAMSSQILERFSGKPNIKRSGTELLSDREFEVFQLIGKGVSTRDIGKKLHLSTKTVDAHRAHIKQKLKIKEVSQLISYAAVWSSEAMKPE